MGWGGTEEDGSGEGGKARVRSIHTCRVYVCIRTIGATYRRRRARCTVALGSECEQRRDATMVVAVTLTVISLLRAWK